MGDRYDSSGKWLDNILIYYIDSAANNNDIDISISSRARGNQYSISRNASNNSEEDISRSNLPQSSEYLFKIYKLPWICIIWPI